MTVCVICTEKRGTDGKLLAEVGCASGGEWPDVLRQGGFRARDGIMNKVNTSQLNVMLGLVVAFLPATGLANGMRLVSQDAFATGRGEAFVATADNASAIYYNPAGITQLEGTQIRSGIYGLYFDPTYQPPATAPNSGKTYHVKNNLAAAPQTFFTHTFKDSRWSYGLGLYAPFGLGLEWPQDTGFRSVAIESKLTYLRLNPVVAYKITPQLSIAAGVTLNYADLLLEQGLRARELPFQNFFRFQGDGLSVGYNAGILWQPDAKISFGATFRSSTPFTLEGETQFKLQPVIPDTHRDAAADFEFPLSAAVGVSWRPTPKWNIEFDADYADWSSLGTVTIHQATPPPFPVRQDIPFQLQWQPSWLYSFGATRYFDNGWHASVGYTFNQNSVPNAYYSPLVADLDRHFVSAGVGIRGRKYDVDVAYQFGYGPDRTVTGSTPPSQPGQFAGQTADGTYGFISHAIFVTVGIRF